MKWRKVAKDTEVGLNQELLLECDAVGSPEPTVEWLKHSPPKDQTSNGIYQLKCRNMSIMNHTNLCVLTHDSGTSMIARGPILKIPRIQHKDSGLYECLAKNGVDDMLRQIVQVKVRGK